VIARVPGKVLLAGEYAVLEGHPAVVMAVGKYATARLAAEPQELSPFLEAARKLVGTEAAERLARVVVDTSAFYQGEKLGLGSSAAATVAAVRLALPEARLEEIHRLAHLAHAEAQGARGSRGSGADIAACVWGGTLEVRRDREPPSVKRLPDLRHFSLVSAGMPADTVTLVGHIRALRERDPQAHASLLEGLGAVAVSLAAALQAGDQDAAVRAISDGHLAMAALAERSGAHLIPPAFEEVRGLAHMCGGATKTTGAGGGDLLLAVFPEANALARFQDSARACGKHLVITDVSQAGATLAEGSQLP
jgi:phosphomevalonate kinase